MHATRSVARSNKQTLLKRKTDLPKTRIKSFSWQGAGFTGLGCRIESVLGAGFDR